MTSRMKKGLEAMALISLLRDLRNFESDEIKQSLSDLLEDVGIPALKKIVENFGKTRIPKIDGSLRLEGLKADAKVYRDSYGVPHIYAENESDLFYVQGYVHAQDRLWQMELNRRSGSGTLAEIFGDLALDSDILIRTFGFNRLGRQDRDRVSPEVRNAIQAYVDGINAYINGPDFKAPLEFLLLGIKASSWSYLDPYMFSRMMIWQMSHSWYDEIIRTWIIEKVGAKHAAEIEIHYPSSNPPVLEKGIELNSLDLNNNKLTGKDSVLKRGLGSNNWAIAPEKSATGSAILCNDMHMPISAPALWYQCHLRCPTIDSIGISLAGLPFVLAGHNKDIAWGMTLGFTDCEDLYVEEFKANDKRKYKFKAKWLEAESIHERIEVKGRKYPHVEEILRTRNGPVISDSVGYPEKRVTVKSMALRPSNIMEGFNLLNRSRNWDDFGKAMAFIEAPQLNVAYADCSGNIGYWLTGKVPVRKKGNGSLPSPGWTDSHDWTGEIPIEEMPKCLNPEKKFVVTCNNKVTGEDYPHYLGNSFMNGYRARRVTEYLSTLDKVSLEDCKKLHVDFTLLPAKEFKKHISRLKHEDQLCNRMIEMVKNWDCVLNKESVGGCIFEVWRHQIIRGFFTPGLGAELTEVLMGKGFHPAFKSSNEFYGYDTVTMLRLLDNSDSWWIKNAGGKTSLLKASLEKARDYLISELGEDLLDWRWGKIHQAVVPHALGIQKPLDKIFNLGPFPMGGNTDTTCQAAYFAEDPYDMKAWAPSVRMVIDLGDFNNSVINVAPGQSGQLGSPHYDDQLQDLLNGNYIPMLWSDDDIKSHSKNVLELKR